VHPTTTSITFSASGSPAQHQYTLQRSSAANTYAITLLDASFPDIVYATLSTVLTTTATGDPLLPQEFTLNLFNPSSAVSVRLHHSALRGNYWQFSLPRASFLHPTASQLDTTYHPPSSELLTFRWRRTGGLVTKPQLQCVLVSNGKGDEPDLAVAMYYGVGDKAGKGELVVYEGNFRRVDTMDLKGLEMVLVVSARVVNDVWFRETASVFNAPHVAAKQRGRGASAPIPVAMEGGQGTFSQRFAAQEEKIPFTPADQAARERIRKEQEEIHRMLAAEEAAERRRKQAAIDAETQRLRRVYEQEQRQLHQAAVNRRASVPQQVDPRYKPQRIAYRPPPPRVVQPQRMSYAPQRPPVVGAAPAGLMPIPAPNKEVGRRKSFLGFGLGCEGKEEKEKEKEKKKKGKLVKKSSSMW
jgi:hypothetical protein